MTGDQRERQADRDDCSRMLIWKNLGIRALNAAEAAIRMIETRLSSTKAMAVLPRPLPATRVGGT